MESRKIINLLDHKDDDDPRFQTKNGIVLMTKIMVSMVMEMKMTLQLSLVQML